MNASKVALALLGAVLLAAVVTVLGLLPLFVGLAAFGSVMTLVIVLYSNRFFTRPFAAVALRVKHRGRSLPVRGEG